MILGKMLNLNDSKIIFWPQIETLTFTVDPNFEVSDPDLMAWDHDPKPVIPDPAYHVMTLT